MAASGPERIPLLAVDEARRRGREAGLREELAAVNAFRTLLNNPAAGGAAGRLLTTLLFEGSLDARTRELVILRTGWRSGSEYEFCQHVGVSRRLKIPEQDILGVRDPDSCPSYSEVDRAVIRMADELVEGTEVSPATWAVLARAYAAPQLIELLLVAGTWRMFATLFNSARVPLDPGVPSWPEGRKPEPKAPK